MNKAYKVISEGLVEGFRNLGLDAYFAVPETEADREKLKRPHSAVCFDASSWYELVVEGRKVAGSAQTRQKGVILQHGSILQDIDADDLFDMFIFKHDRLKDKMKADFANKAIAINDIRETPVTIAEMESAFEEGFKKGLNVAFKPLTLTDAQLEEVAELEEKFRSEAWTYRK